MAISFTHYCCFREAFRRKLLPYGGDLLEIGEANWYGDDPAIIARDIAEFAPSEERRNYLHGKLNESCAMPQREMLFMLAKVVYGLFVAPKNTLAIDFHGMEGALRADLNEPVELDRQFDLTINHGTAEHIFNIAQVFRTIHQWTKPGGVMIHESPLTGWFDHGFYNLQPTLFFDLAAQNAYAMPMLAVEAIGKGVKGVGSRDELLALAKVGEIPDNAMLYVVMKKPPVELPFNVPIQGYYAGTIGDDARQAWREMR